MGCGASTRGQDYAPSESPTRTDVVSISSDAFKQGDWPRGSFLEDEAKDEKAKTVKVLLLGAGETGKSTILKQLCLQCGQREKLNLDHYRQWLVRNVVVSAKSLVVIAEKQGLVLDEVAKVLVSSMEDDCRPSDEEVHSIRELWQDGPLRKAWEINAETPTEWVMDMTPYYLDNLDVFCESDFTPADEDILRTRTLTVGVNMVEFADEVNPSYLMSYLPLADAAKIISSTGQEHLASLTWQVIDVGGQRGERRKWIHCLDDILCLVWTVGLTEYKQVLYEETETLRIHESMELFGHWSNQKQFRHMPIMLVFTKRDMFEDTYDEARFRSAFPSFKGGGMDQALAFLGGQFKSKIEDRAQLNSMSTFIVDTTDPNDFQDMLDALRSLVAKHNAGFIAKVVQEAGGKNTKNSNRTSRKRSLW